MEDEVGNPIEQFTTLKLQVSVKLDENKQQNQIVSQIGKDFAITYLQGRSVNPHFFPNFIKEQAQFDCTITDVITGTPLIGRFVLTSLLQSKWKPVTKMMGTQFEGFFIPD